MVFKMRTATKQFVVLRDGGLNYRASRNLVEFKVQVICQPNHISYVENLRPMSIFIRIQSLDQH